MKNSRAKSVLNDCRLELLKIRGLINSYGSMHTITGFLTQYALIKVSGTFEICYKTIIADYYDSFSPKLQRFVSKQVREASLNATYENITKVLKLFDEVKWARLNLMLQPWIRRKRVPTLCRTLIKLEIMLHMVL